MATVKKLDTAHIVKLDDTNYHQWKLQITLVLKAAEVWTVVSGEEMKPEDDDDVQDWNKKDITAQAIMVPTLSKHQSNHVCNSTTAKEMFDKLEELNSDSSTLNKQRTLTSFFNYKVKTTTSIVTAFLEMEQLARSLNEMGVMMDETTVITKIVSSLPDAKYEAFKKAWDSVPDDKQSMRMLLARLKKEELEQQKVTEDDGKTSEKTTAFSSQQWKSNKNGKRSQIDNLKKRTKCNNCGKIGHWYKECRSVKKTNQAPSNAQNTMYLKNQANMSAFLVSQDLLESASPFQWISDSGATQHITGYKDWYEEYVEFETPKTLSLTDKHKAYAKGIGRIKVEAYMQDNWQQCTISNVLYIPGAVNLFSETVMAQKGYTVVRSKKETIFYEEDGRPGPMALFRDYMFVMLFRRAEARAHASRFQTSNGMIDLHILIFAT